VAALSEARFVEVIAVLVVAAVATIAGRVADRWLADHSQGVLIDVRPSPPLISRVAGIPSGFLVIIDHEGNATPHQARPDNRDSIASVVRAALATHS
jgi:hypothetical protein